MIQYGKSTFLPFYKSGQGDIQFSVDSSELAVLDFGLTV